MGNMELPIIKLFIFHDYTLCETYTYSCCSKVQKYEMCECARLGIITSVLIRISAFIEKTSLYDLYIVVSPTFFFFF